MDIINQGIGTWGGGDRWCFKSSSGNGSLEERGRKF